MNPMFKKYEPEASNVYESHHGNIYKIIYVDEQIVLLRDKQKTRNGDNIHRMELRSTFDKIVESGQLEYKPDLDVDIDGPEEQDWSEVSYIGEKTSERLNDAGFNSNFDIQQATDEELLAIDGLGEGGLTNLRQYSES